MKELRGVSDQYLTTRRDKSLACLSIYEGLSSCLYTARTKKERGGGGGGGGGGTERESRSASVSGPQNLSLEGNFQEANIPHKQN